MIKQYFMRNALKVLKEPYGKLKYSFIDPGAGYEGNLWDWDSFFTAKALCESFSVLSEQEGKRRNHAFIPLKDYISAF